MQFGVFVPPVVDSSHLIKAAEDLGFYRAWMYDTPMLNSELFVSLTAAVMRTSKIRIAPGVMIPGNRIAPVAASGLATLNALAPGRIDWGMGTGFTARRTLGQRPVKLSDLEEYVRVVRGLLGGETLEWEFEAKKRKIRFLDPDIGAINIKDPISLHMSAFGPKARETVAKLGAGLIDSPHNLEHGRANMAHMKKAWVAAGRNLRDLKVTAAIPGCVLKEGESHDSPRVKSQTGPHATIALHSLIESEEFGDIGRAPPPFLAPILDKYREIYKKYEPADARYLSNHRGHLMFLRPEEEALCSGDFIKAATWTATKPELIERMRELKAIGYEYLCVEMGFRHPEKLREWAEVFEAL
ncbi:MAG: LLM class flavin-dependent oxidoreductase [Betaproteobacteria bacterium]|nr:LLM class flavin-dependent oxidoreductase [Betaproteobacteria bacterium]